MPTVIKDRVKETTTTVGTGTITLAGAVAGFQSFSVIGNGNSTYYTIVSSDQTQWEVGIGTYTASGTTLSRDTVLGSTNAGAKVDFSAGTKTVFVTYPADTSVYASNSPGASGQVLKSTGSGAVPNWAAPIDIQTFDISGTWTKPAGVSVVYVELWGGGGGGSAGFAGTTSNPGGAGGGGGGYIDRYFVASDLPSTVAITVGAGGAGGTTVSSTAMVFGVAGGSSSFGTFLVVGGGAAQVFNASFASTQPQSSGGGIFAGGNPRTYNATNIIAGGNFGTITDYQANLLPSAYSGGAGSGRNGSASTSGGQVSLMGGCGGGGGGAIDASGYGWLGSIGGAYTYDLNPENQTKIGNSSGSNGSNATVARAGGAGGNANSLTQSVSSSLAYGNGRFVLINKSSAGLAAGYVLTSTNGTSWTVSPITGIEPQATSLNVNSALPLFTELRYLNSQFVALAYTSNNYINIAVSTDGIAWTPKYKSTHNPTNKILSLFYFGGTYVAVGNGGLIQTSTDLITWTTQTSGTTQNLTDVTHDGTNWVVVGVSGITLTSTNATSWTLNTAVTGTPSFIAVAAGGGVVVATATNTPFAWRSTNNGTTWTAVATTLVSGLDVTYANATFVASGAPGVNTPANSVVYTSTDGNTWTTQTDGTTDTYCGIAYSGSIWFIASSSANTTIGISSTDLVAWTPRTLSAYIGQGGNGGNGLAPGGGGGGGASTNGTVSQGGVGGSGANGRVIVRCW